MKSIFSTQNLHTFFFRKYCRLPRARPPGPPGPAPPASVTAVASSAFTPRSSAGRRCLFLFLCHTFHPFTFGPDRVGVNSLVSPGEPGSSFRVSTNSSWRAALACRGGLFRRGG